MASRENRAKSDSVLPGLEAARRLVELSPAAARGAKLIFKLSGGASAASSPPPRSSLSTALNDLRSRDGDCSATAQVDGASDVRAAARRSRRQALRAGGRRRARRDRAAPVVNAPPKAVLLHPRDAAATAGTRSTSALPPLRIHTPPFFAPPFALVCGETRCRLGTRRDAEDSAARTCTLFYHLQLTPRHDALHPVPAYIIRTLLDAAAQRGAASTRPRSRSPSRFPRK